VLFTTISHSHHHCLEIDHVFRKSILLSHTVNDARRQHHVILDKTFHIAALDQPANMDTKQLQEAGKQISKVIEGGDPPATVLQILQPLQKWTATEDLLRQSKIGVWIAKLRQHKDKQVAEQASKLVNKWKTDVNSNKRKSTGSPAPGSAAAKINGGANGRAGGTSSPAPPVPAAVKKEARKSTVDPAKRTSKTDEISTAVTGNQTRDSCVELMYNGLAFLSEESRKLTQCS
jgi:transcription elongation factor S-II